MDIVTQFKNVTTCENCCCANKAGLAHHMRCSKKVLYDEKTKGPYHPHVPKKFRCDDGMWIWSLTDMKDGEEFWAMDIGGFLGTIFAGQYTVKLVPREMWPKTKEERYETA